MKPRLATPVARKALIIGLMLLWLKQFSGLFVMISYAGRIFTDSGSKIEPNIAAIVVAFVQLVGTYSATILVDKAGRKVYLELHTLKP